MCGVVGEEIVARGLVQEVVRNHAGPGVSQTRVAVWHVRATYEQDGNERLHSSVSFGLDTPEKTAKEPLVLSCENIGTTGGDERDIKHPPAEPLATEDKVVDGRPTVEVHRGCDP